MAVKVLIDPSTGEQFQVEVPESSGNGDGSGSGPAPQAEPERFHRSPQLSERQMKVLLANDGKPSPILEKYWGLGPKLAVTKITDDMEYYRFRLRVENALRTPFLQNDKNVDNTTLLDLELMDLDAKLDLARSQTDDDHASLLELLTVLNQTVRAKQENHPIPGQSSGIMGAIASRILGRGRR